MLRIESRLSKKIYDNSLGAKWRNKNLSTENTSKFKVFIYTDGSKIKHALSIAAIESNALSLSAAAVITPNIRLSPPPGPQKRFYSKHASM